MKIFQSPGFWKKTNKNNRFTKIEMFFISMILLLKDLNSSVRSECQPNFIGL